MIKTLKYYFNSRLMFIGVLSGIVLLLSFTYVQENSFLKWYFVGPNFTEVEGPDNAPYYFYSLIAGLLATIIPIYEFGFKMNKICIDQMYSLPIKREKLYVSKFIIGFIEITIPLFISYLYGFLVVSSSRHMFDIIYFLPFFLCLLLITLCVYSLITFFFTRANTKRDGIINIGFITFFFVVVSLLINNVFNLNDKDLNLLDFFIYSPLSIIVEYFNFLTKKKGLDSIGYLDTFEFDISQIISLVLFAILSLIAFALFIHLNKKEKAENSTQISNSWFSYKFFIPAYLFMLSTLLGINLSTLDGVIIMLIAGFIGYVIYRRTLKIKKKDIFIIAICIFLGLIIGNIIFSIHNIID